MRGVRDFGSSFGWNLGSSRCPPGAGLVEGCAGLERGGTGEGGLGGRGGRDRFCPGRFHVQRTHPLQRCLAGKFGVVRNSLFLCFSLERVLDY